MKLPPDLGKPGDAASPDAEESVAALKAEIAALRAQLEQHRRPRTASPARSGGPPRGPVEEIQDSEDHASAERTLLESHHLLLELVDNSPSVMFVKDLNGRHLMVNRRFAELWQMPREEILGKTDKELFPADVAAALYAKDQEIMAAGHVVSFEETVPTPGREMMVVLTIKFPLYDAGGKLAGICGIATDISALKRSEAERASLQEQVIEAQRAALRELSTPLVPIADGVLAMPIVGSIDAVRAQQILETLLEGISAQRAHTAILDITGVRVVDGQVAGALVSAARAAQLLGARVLLTGIRPEVAQALVELSIDLTGVVTLSTLQSGVAHALGR